MYDNSLLATIKRWIVKETLYIIALTSITVCLDS